MLQWMLARLMSKHPARCRSIALSFPLDDVLIDDAWQGQSPIHCLMKRDRMAAASLDGWIEDCLAWLIDARHLCPRPRET